MACACDLIRERTGLALVALSGGVMQNALLFTRLHRALAARSFEVLSHTLTPPNDGSISLGQVAVAAAQIKQEGEKGKRAKRAKGIKNTTHFLHASALFFYSKIDLSMQNPE